MPSLCRYGFKFIKCNLDAFSVQIDMVLSSLNMVNIGYYRKEMILLLRID